MNKNDKTNYKLQLRNVEINKREGINFFTTEADII